MAYSYSHIFSEACVAWHTAVLYTGSLVFVFGRLPADIFYIDAPSLKETDRSRSSAELGPMACMNCAFYAGHQVFQGVCVCAC